MGQHWYDKNGNPVYQILMSDKKNMRDTTLRDARKYQYVPSVTTIFQGLSKPMLQKWQINQTLEAVLKIGMPAEFENVSVEEWKKSVISLSKNIGEKSAKRGTEIHNALEKYYLTKQVTHDEYIMPCIQKLDKELKASIYGEPEIAFAHKLGFGGKIDLSAQGRFILDYKTKAKDDPSEKDIYDEYGMQLAAYRHGLRNGKNQDVDYKCYNLLVSTTRPGSLYWHEWTEQELDRCWKMFYNLLEFWKAQNKYDSSF